MPEAAASLPAFDFNLLADSESTIFAVMGFDGYFRAVNPGLVRALGRERDELLATSMLELIHPADVDPLLRLMNRLQDERGESGFESRWLHRDGSEIWLWWTTRFDPRTHLWYGVAHDVSAYRAGQRALEEARERLDLAMSVAWAGSWELDLRELSIALDVGAQRLLGLDAEVEPGTTNARAFLQSVHAGDRDRLLESIERLGREGGLLDIDFRLEGVRGKSVRYLALRGSTVERDRRNRPLRATGIAFDVTHQKSVEEQLQNLAVRDPLTGVHNRRRFDDALQIEWQRGLRSGKTLSLLMIDVDHFKAYNDNYGHLAGDDALRRIASELQEHCTRPSDVFARYGGEEFALLLPESSGAAAQIVGERVLDCVRRLQLPHRGSPLGVVTASVGHATMVSFEGSRPTTLVGLADQALYRAKHAGRDRLSD